MLCINLLSKIKVGRENCLEHDPISFFWLFKYTILEYLGTNKLEKTTRHLKLLKLPMSKFKIK